VRGCGVQGRISGVVLGLIAIAACSPPAVPQRDPILPVPVRRPEIEVNADRAPDLVDDARSLLRFRGRLTDRIDPGRLEQAGGRFARVVLVFELEPTLDVATIRLSAPYRNLPLLRIGEIYQVDWQVATEDPLGLPDLRVEIRSEAGQLLYLMASGGGLPAETLLDGLELKSARRPAFHTDFEAGAGCRVRRRHYATRVGDTSLEAGDAWLMPTDDLELARETGRWRLTILDNSVALKGGCDKLVAQELAHRTVVLQFIE
jgi:hypothetical protein